MPRLWAWTNIILLEPSCQAIRSCLKHTSCECLQRECALQLTVESTELPVLLRTGAILDDAFFVVVRSHSAYNGFPDAPTS